MSNAIQVTVSTTVAAIHRLWAAAHGIDLRDDRGVEDSPAKMIWIAAAIIIAGLATAFAINIFNDARVERAVARRAGWRLTERPVDARPLAVDDRGTSPGWRSCSRPSSSSSCSSSSARSSCGGTPATSSSRRPPKERVPPPRPMPAASAAEPAAARLAAQMGGAWVESLAVTCDGDGPEGSIVSVRVSASTPLFAMPGSLSVSAVASAPSEGTAMVP